ncbi:hypothetical protein [Paraburkholderia sp. GAS32]|uniref:hypothetical protein n=1 Tax=Paraburkholderia sp. GAS32 TaxID=3035129 RepID=UPI003D239BCE
MNLIRLTVAKPDPQQYARVLVYTEGHDFNGEQFFDVKAEDLTGFEDPEDQSEVCRYATHWMPRPDSLQSQQAEQAVFEASIAENGVDAAHRAGKARLKARDLAYAIRTLQEAIPYLAEGGVRESQIAAALRKVLAHPRLIDGDFPLDGAL